MSITYRSFSMGDSTCSACGIIIRMGISCGFYYAWAFDYFRFGTFYWNTEFL